MIKIICKECGTVQEELFDFSSEGRLNGLANEYKRCFYCHRLLDWEDATLKIRVK